MSDHETLRDCVAELEAERDHLRAFLQWEPDPSPTGWAWCCFCQEPHPIDRPHVDGNEHKARMDGRARAMAEIRGLKAEIERLARGEFTDKTLELLVAQNDRQEGLIRRLKAVIADLRASHSAEPA